MQQSQRKDAEESWVTGVEIAGPAVPGLDKILSAEACAFVAMLERSFGGERRRLLAARTEFQAGIDAGDNPAFRPETKTIRDAEWTVAGTPDDLADRAVGQQAGDGEGEPRQDFLAIDCNQPALHLPKLLYRGEDFIVRRPDHNQVVVIMGDGGPQGSRFQTEAPDKGGPDVPVSAVPIDGRDLQDVPPGIRMNPAFLDLHLVIEHSSRWKGGMNLDDSRSRDAIR